MKTKKLILCVTFMLALTLIVILSQNKAEAQDSSDDLSCEILFFTQSNTVVDRSSSEECAKCVVWTIREEWNPLLGIGTKYESAEVPATGVVITCKSTTKNESCTERSLSGFANCPEMPADLHAYYYGTNGTGNSTGTGTAH